MFSNMKFDNSKNRIKNHNFEFYIAIPQVS